MGRRLGGRYRGSIVDIADAYLDTYERMRGFGAALDAQDQAVIVPACPAWTVKDVFAHVCGIAADLVAGRSAPSRDDQTARQVDERRGMTLQGVLDEWQEAVEGLVALMRASGSVMTPVIIDAWTHEQDVRNALGRSGGREAPGLHLTLKAAIAADRRVTAAGLPPMHLTTGDKTWYLGAGAREGAAAVTIDLDPYEAARMLMGRRTYAEMRGYPWQGDPEPYLPLLHQFTVPAEPLGE